MFDLIIKGGKIITASDEYIADIGIKEGKISRIDEDIKAEDGKEVIDASGYLVMPGGIEAHTHLDMPFGGTFSSDDFYTGTKAAAVGGTTTVIDYAIQGAGMTLDDTAKTWREKADNKACIDYGLHVAITDTSGKTLDDIQSMVDAGYTSYKVFMVYDGMRVEDDDLIAILERAAEAGAVIGVHAENYFIIKKLVAELLEAGKCEPKHHAMSRPAVAEGEAANRAISMAKVANAPIMIVHNSCKESISKIKEAREAGLNVMGETCPQYLLLSTDNYEEEGFNGAKYVMSPPLRDKSNWDYIWDSLKDGTLQTVATDHCPFFMEQKELGKDDFSKIPNGAPGIELRMALMLTYGQRKGLSLQKIVELTSTNVAKIYGMYPKKGTIAVGSDADIYIYDSKGTTTVTVDNLHENVDYTPYEGFELDGKGVITLSRGRILAKDNEYCGVEKEGQFLKREKGHIL